jgi:membrane protease YdiL (CAAX protease family)
LVLDFHGTRNYHQFKLKQNFKAKLYILGCVILWLLPKEIWWVLPLYLVTWPLACGLKLESSPTNPRLIIFLLLFICAISGFSQESLGLTCIFVINQWLLIALPEEVFFRMAFYETFEKKNQAATLLALSNMLVFVLFHSRNSDPIWLFWLTIPSLFLAFLGLKWRNLWLLSLVHLLINLCDRWITGDFMRLIT